MDFWKQEPKFFIKLHGENLKKGQTLYDHQINHLGSALIIDDYDAQVPVDKCTIVAESNFIFPKDSLLSGSFVTHHVVKHVGLHYLPDKDKIKFDDIDVYFKTKEDAQEFIKLNGGYGFEFNNPMCSYGHISGHKFNLIYGVEYNSPENLISRFDIRACSMAIDMNTSTLYVVEGAVEDSTQLKITFNPVPRGVTVRRLTKYIKKGFNIDSHQSMFFVELCRSPIYSPKLELMTKEY